MKVLSVDTSTQYTSLSLMWDSEYEERMIDKPFSPSEDLLHEIIELLKRHSGDISEIDLFVGAKGPGSFTGLRVGISELKGFALALNKPLVTIGTLEAIEYTVPTLNDTMILSAIDGKKKRFYVRGSLNGDTLLNDSDLTVESIYDIIKDYKTFITGPDAPSLYDKLLLLGKKDITLDRLSPRNIGRALIELGIERYKSVGEDDIGEGPVYIRRTDAEENLETKEKNV